MDLYPYDLFFFAFLFFFSTIIFFIMLFRTRAIETVEDKRGQIIFRVFQKGINGFLVKGYRGNYRRVSFKTYTDVVAYIDKRINKWF